MRPRYEEHALKYQMQSTERVQHEEIPFSMAFSLVYHRRFVSEKGTAFFVCGVQQGKYSNASEKFR